MSRFHESIREFLEDVGHFLSESLHQEILSSRAITQKEALLMKLQMLHRLYPQLQLNLPYVADDPDAVPSSPVSPTSYIDMQGNCTKKVMNEMFEDNYELCESDKSVTSDFMTSLEFEDHNLNDECKYSPLPATQVQAFEKYGFLEKKGKERFGGLINKYQRRWYGIKDGLMYYYEKSTDQTQKGVIPLCGYEIREVQSKDNKKKNYYSFELVCPGKHTYQFTAVSEKDMKQWISAIERNNKGYVRTTPKENGFTEIASDKDNTNIYDDSCNVEDIYEMVEDEERNLKRNSLVLQRTDVVNFNCQVMRSGKQDSRNNNPSQIFDYQNLYVGLWDCKADDETELDFRYGDIIRIVSKEYDSHAWWIGELNGKVGFVPKSYLMEAYSTY